MSILKKLLIFIIILVMMIVLQLGVSNTTSYVHSHIDKGIPVKIAVFQDNANAMYISLLRQNLELIQKENEDKVNFTFFNANDNQTIQNESIDKALKENYDLFIVGIVSTNLKDVESALRKIMDKNMPLIINPDTSQDILNFMKPYKQFVIIGADFEQSGTMEGKILVNEWNFHKESIDKNHDDVLQYVMLRGRIGSPLTYLRTKYSVLALNDAGIKTEELSSPHCEWIQDCAENAIESLFLRYGNKIEAIISNNDAMAIGAVEALQKYGYNKGSQISTIPVVGIDGMPAAKELINKGFMTGTVIVEPHDLAEALYAVGMNLAKGRSPVENTNYKLDDTGFIIHLNYSEYVK